MNILKDIEPKKVFRYFEEICQIPHGSYDTKRISDYCVKFAEDHQLFYMQDEWNNVLIVKEAAPGYEKAETVLLQGHLDMVCEKTPDAVIDFKKDGLKIKIDGDFVTAEDTTLGGDDGIAVAYALAILADNTLKHPRLEVLFTSEEEVGMDGAKGMDTSMMKATRMLNLDSEEEGYLLTSCAGGFRGNCHIPVKREAYTGIGYTVRIHGLLGGHSGMEIDKNRANSNKLMGRFLNHIKDVVDYRIADIAGGLKDNAIAKDTTVSVLVSEAQCALLEERVRAYQQIFKSEYSLSDPDIIIEYQSQGNKTAQVIDTDAQKSIVFFLLQVPSGLIKMSDNIKGLPETSLNLGILKLEEGHLHASFAVRSSVYTEKIELSEKLASFMEFLNGSYEVFGDYPAWEYDPDSKLRKLMIDVFKEQYGKEPKVEAIHAGLECGILLDKMKGMDCVSIGPDMFDVHTTDERLSISSTKRVWEYLIKVLEACK